MSKDETKLVEDLTSILNELENVYNDLKNNNIPSNNEIIVKKVGYLYEKLAILTDKITKQKESNYKFKYQILVILKKILPWLVLLSFSTIYIDIPLIGVLIYIIYYEYTDKKDKEDTKYIDDVYNYMDNYKSEIEGILGQKIDINKKIRIKK